MSPRATPLPPDERRRAIIDVVVPLLQQRGSAVSTREIAAAAGIAEGTIFRVFPDKAALWTAVAEQTLDPEVERSELRAAVAPATDLRDQVVAAAAHLFARSQKVTAVMMAMREVWMSCPDGGRHDHVTRPPRPPGPPALMVEANAALLDGLTELFEAHRHELRVEPGTAATVLRALVLGTRHPGAVVDPTLTPDLIADLLLRGVGRDAAPTTWEG